MAMDLDIKIYLTGDKKLDKRFKKLEKRVQVNAIRRAMRRGNKLFRLAGRSNAPIHTGRLKKAIKSKVSKQFEVITGTTYVESGKGTKNDAFYATMVEFGTKTRYKTRPIYHPGGKSSWIRTDKTGKTVPKFSVGRYRPPSRFMTRAFLDNKDAAIHAFQKEIKNTVIKEFGL